MGRRGQCGALLRRPRASASAAVNKKYRPSVKKKSACCPLQPHPTRPSYSNSSTGTPTLHASTLPCARCRPNCLTSERGASPSRTAQTGGLGCATCFGGDGTSSLRPAPAIDRGAIHGRLGPPERTTRPSCCARARARKSNRPWSSDTRWYALQLECRCLSRKADTTTSSTTAQTRRAPWCLHSGITQTRRAQWCLHSSITQKRTRGTRYV